MWVCEWEAWSPGRGPGEEGGLVRTHKGRAAAGRQLRCVEACEDGWLTVGNAPGAQVQSLVEELKSHMLSSVAKKKKAGG